MEYVISPAVLVTVLSLAYPAITNWFFETFVEPKAKLERNNDGANCFSPVEPDNAQKIAATRKSLDELRLKISQSKG